MDGDIATTNRLFVRIDGYGQCDERGRPVFAAGGRRKLTAAPDKPMRTLIIPLLGELLSFCKFDDSAEADADLAALRKYVEGITLKRNK